MRTLKTIIVLLASALVLPCFAQQKTVTAVSKVVKDVVHKNIGLQLYSLREEIGGNSENIDEVITKVGKMGYKYVEAANYADGKFYGLTPQAFKAKLAANGMFALSSHTGHALAEDISKTNWDEVWAWWDKCIADHKAAGMKYIITPSMPTPATLEGLQAYCDYYNKIGEKCAAAGLKFGYHNHNYEFEKKYPDGTVMYDYMVSHTDPSKVFFEMDVYWVVRGQRAPVELFKKYPGRFLVLHIKDETELGESGMVGFDAIFKHIQTAGTKYLIVEVERYDLPHFESVQKSLDYLNNASFVKFDYSK
jgi:sugar phosphate isomerase/epimerase